MIFFYLRRKMSLGISVRLLDNAKTAEKKLMELKTKLEALQRFKVEEKIKQLSTENELLASKVEEAKEELIKLETRNGKKQYTIPNKTLQAVNIIESKTPVNSEEQDKDVNKKEKKDKVQSKKGQEKNKGKEVSDVVDVRKLDFRIGKIVDVNKHPDADTLYVEKIDCGEERPRTVVSGLVNHVPIEEMKDRVVMVLCNLKPVKMRGITSEAMVMCGSSSEKVEVLIPPNSSVPGDLVTCEGYPREPEAQLNPKKKIFETCAPDLKTNGDRVACYKGSPLVVPGKGPIVAPTLKNVNVK